MHLSAWLHRLSGADAQGNVAVAVIIGGIAYWPICESTIDLRQTVATIAVEANQLTRVLTDKAVTREELNWR